ncbi:general secretory pathway component, cryptic [Candidatus Desulfarcum epimagneticum]|uniref:protein-secreting ATPase n=1 Tax=uncultured Desulfobacteraceae bacterium TaxID=218296 RepID=A0A484HBI4_9BACT|nr:general secretory pathway component, cryptic [uncultured Desulfobacteraceae bacterium]
MGYHLTDILKKRLGLSDPDMEEALERHSGKGGDIGAFLVGERVISETDLLETLSAVHGLPFMDRLPGPNPGDDFAKSLQIQFLKKHLMVPLGEALPEWALQNPGDPPPWEVGEYVIAVRNPACFQALEDMARTLGVGSYTLVLSTREAIVSTINMAYDLSRDSAERLVQDMEEDGDAILSKIQETRDILDDAGDAPIIKLVNHIISQAVKARASDIHIEPGQDKLKVRRRVDGILYDLLSPPKWIQPALISRIKVMAKLNIAEKRLPQDGRMEVKIGDTDIDVRVSIIPTSFGERVVMRLLVKSASLVGLPELGLDPDDFKTLQKIIRSPNGIVLVTGPTGSGKTTTLYAVLSSMNRQDINIITIEDPVEYQINGISQIQVNPKIDLTFARGLRSIVRQDPDVILVGEIRDRETAEIAVQSALTGHLVFSTLHTNDSAGAITRLVDIGVEPFLISSSVVAVIAQRLVRILCDHCKQPHTPDESLLRMVGVRSAAGHVIYQADPGGCENCFHTGYKGRIGIFEIMLLTDSVKSLILKDFDSNLIKKEAVENRMTTLRESAVQKMLAGITTIEEVIRVTRT